MVDTINPNTNQPDSWDDQPAPTPAPTPNASDMTPKDRFFGGFDRPNDVKINLADKEQPPADVQPVKPVYERIPPQAAQPVADVAPAKPLENKGTSYVNTAEAVNMRGILVLVVIGLLATALVGGGIYFGLGSLNKSKLEQEQATLDNLKNELATLEKAPAALELPVTETPTEEEETPAVTTPEPTPVETPVETPIEVPATTPVEGDNNLG